MGSREDEPREAHGVPPRYCRCLGRESAYGLRFQKEPSIVQSCGISTPLLAFVGGDVSFEGIVTIVSIGARTLMITEVMPLLT